MNFLVVYASRYGHTAQVAERIAERLRHLGHAAQVREAGKPLNGLRPADFDGILVGASIHGQRFQRSVHRFVADHLDALQRRPSAFFAVCMAIASQSEHDREEAHRIARELPAREGWVPTRLRVFAGALAFSRYNFFITWIMKRISEKELGHPLDTRHDYVFTDWDHVDAFADEFARLVQPAAPLEPPNA